MRHKETPLAEVTLRKYEKPYALSGRELTKKLCLSLGLLQPGDSRDIIVDIVHVLTRAQEPLTTATIEQEVARLREAHNLPLSGLASSNVRRQLRRLKDVFLIERVGQAYRFAENESLPEVFEQKIEKFYLPAIVSRIKEYCDAVEKERWSK